MMRQRAIEEGLCHKREDQTFGFNEALNELSFIPYFYFYIYYGVQMFPVSGVSLFGSCVTCVCIWSADQWHHGMGEKKSLLILLHKRVGQFWL